MQVILMLMTNGYVTGEVVYVHGSGRVVSQCSIESIHDRWSGNVPTVAIDAHISAVSDS